MKNVIINSKVVAKGGTLKAALVGGGNTPSADMTGYLPKSVWDNAFEVRTDTNGISYIYCRLHIVGQYGVTMYADDGDLDLSSIYAGIPIDGVTLYWDNGVLKAAGGTGGGESGGGVVTGPVSWENVQNKPSWIGSSKPSYTWSEISGKPSWIGSSKPSYTWSEISGKPTKVSEFDNDVGYVKASDLGEYLPITGGELQGSLGIKGNLVVSGGIVAYGTDGKTTSFLIDVSSWEGISSTSTTQVYTAKAVKLLKDKVSAVSDTADLANTSATSAVAKLAKIKSALSGISSSSSASAIGAALKTICDNL